MSSLKDGSVALHTETWTTDSPPPHGMLWDSNHTPNPNGAFSTVAEYITAALVPLPLVAKQQLHAVWHYCLSGEACIATSKVTTGVIMICGGLQRALSHFA